MGMEQILTTGLYIVLYVFALWVFFKIVKFVFDEIAPKIMTGKADLQFYISFLSGGLVVILMLTFGPMYVARAMLEGWDKFKVEILAGGTTIIEDFQNLYAGNNEVVFTYDVPTQIPLPPTMIVIPTVTPTVLHTKTATPTRTVVPMIQPTGYVFEPTSTPFDINGWTPDQPVPTP